MSVFDGVLGLLSKMVCIEGISQSDLEMINNKTKVLPGLLDSLAKTWSQMESKQDITIDDLQTLYDILRTSHAGGLLPFSDLEPLLKQKIPEGIISADELYQLGIELDWMSPRVPGTQAMDDTADYIVEKLQSYGLQAWTEPINFNGVFFHDWSLELISPNPKNITCFPQNNVAFADICAEIIDVGHGYEADYTGKDVKGKIVLVNWGELFDHEGPCTLRQRYGLLHLYDLAYSRGAAAMIGYFEDTPGNTLKLVEPGIKPTGGSNVWGQVEAGPDNQFQLPVLNIGHEDGIELGKLLQKEKVECHFVIKGVHKVSTTKAVFGLLPGRTSTTIACGSHSCTAFEGAICDTVGIVSCLALAKYFAAKPLAEREKSMLFFFDSFHVWGNCCQTAIMLEHRHPSMFKKIDSFIWLDHLSDGKADTGRPAITSDNAVMWPLFTLLMAKYHIAPIALPIGRMWSLCATGTFERRGIPAVTVQALNDITLTPEDTWDKFAPDILFRDIMLHIELAQSLQAIKIPQNEPGEPIGGCGALFTGTVLPEYPAGESYVPEASYPLYVGGEHSPITILRTLAEKKAFVGKK